MPHLCFWKLTKSVLTFLPELFQLYYVGWGLLLTQMNWDPLNSWKDCASASCLTDVLIMTEALTDGNGSIFVEVPTTCIAYIPAQVMVTPSQMKSYGKCSRPAKARGFQKASSLVHQHLSGHASPLFNIEWVRKLVSKRRIPKVK